MDDPDPATEETVRKVTKALSKLTNAELPPLNDPIDIPNEGPQLPAIADEAAPTPAEKQSLVQYIGTPAPAAPRASNILKALHILGAHQIVKLTAALGGPNGAAKTAAQAAKTAASLAKDALVNDTNGVHPTKHVGGAIVPMNQGDIKTNLKALIPELDSAKGGAGGAIAPITGPEADAALAAAHDLITTKASETSINKIVDIIAGESDWVRIRPKMGGAKRRRKSRKARKSRKSRRSRRSRKSRRYRRY